MSEKEILEQKIVELEDENLSLKRRIEDLEKELSIVGYLRKESDPMTISSYYLKKYLSIHDEIYKERANALEEKRKSLQAEYDNLMKQEDGLDIIASKNEESISRIKEIDEEINQKYYELEKERYEFEAEVSNVTKLEDSSYQETMSSINEILKVMSRTNDIDVITSITSQIVQALKINLYPLNVIISKNKYKLVRRLQDINVLDQKVKMETKALSAEKKSLESAIQTISLETVESMLDELALEITKVNKSKEELDKLFKMIKPNNLKNIQDEINHLEVLEYTKKEIAGAMDQVINEYYDKLRSLDTTTNIQLNKTMELSKLAIKKKEMDEVKHEYDTKLADYQQLDSIYQNISGNIKTLEEYLQLTTKTIKAKNEYVEFVNRYDGTKTTIKLIQNEILNTENKIKELKETRKLKALDPYAKEAIQELTSQIRKNENLLEKYQEDVRNTTLELEEMSHNERNLKLINILKERGKVESKLPTLYDQQKELGTIVNTKYQELRTLEKKLKDYDEITERIEALESEINN